MYHGIDPGMNQETAQKRKKVLFVVTKSNLGGAQKYVFELATNLRSDSCQTAVVCGPAQDSDAPGPLAAHLEEAGVRTIFVPTLQRDFNVLNDIPAIFALVRIFRAERPDVVHLNSSKAGGVGAFAARIARVPHIVFTSHGLAYDEPRALFTKAVFAALTWFTFLLSHTVICISSDTARRARNLPFCARKVKLVYNGLREPQLLSREAARSRLIEICPDLPRDVPWIGTVSELVPNKGLGYVLRACEELRRDGARFAFLVIGGGEQMDMLRNAINKRGLTDTVFLLGFVPHASRLLRALDIFTLTSRKEGLPYVLLEAAYAELPVIGTDIPGIADVVDDGVSGALCPLSDPDRCADSISGLLEDSSLRTRFGAALHQSVVTKFNFERMLDETRVLY